MVKKKIVKTPEELLQIAKELLQSWILSESTPEVNRLDVVIKPEDIKACIKALIDVRWGYLSAITALDRPEYATVEGSTDKVALADKGNVELLYHMVDGPAIVTFRVLLPYDKASIDSICEVIPSATLYEREAAELLGVDFVGTPSTEHLLLPDEWPVNVYPLRKSFTGLEKTKKVERGE
ncbi:MAG: NADH-quinone oxidoreductase subunit C [Anaerolineaceae bacterium]